MKKNTGNMSFAELALSKRKINTRFFDAVNAMIDWGRIERVIDQFDTRGKRLDGNPCYAGLVLFKMSLLGIWYGLSDRELEDHVNDSISFTRFCGLSLEDSIPDHSIVSRFRTMLSTQEVWHTLLDEVNRQLQEKGLLVRTGTIVDASITESPLKPKGKAQYEVVADNETVESDNGSQDGAKLQKMVKPGVDIEAAWTKKAGKLYYGYKKHHATDMNGIVLAVETTAANTHDGQVLELLVERADPAPKTSLYADKGYCSEANSKYLRSKQLYNGIMKKGSRNHELSTYHKKKNRLISSVRWVVERTFGGQKRWFGTGKARYRGLERTNGQHILEAICYNLRRAPRLLTELNLTC